MRPSNYRIDQLAALHKLVQRSVQLAQILIPKGTGCPGR